MDFGISDTWLYKMIVIVRAVRFGVGIPCGRSGGLGALE